MENSYKWRQFDIRLPAVVISLLLSGLSALLGWIPNEDAFTYLRAVEVFDNEGLVATFRHYPWAAYPVLIGVVHNLLGVDPLIAAVLVNAAFYCVLVYAFISLAGEIDNSQLTLLLAAVVVLVYPQLNEYRLVIIRDSGFWALALFGLWQFIRFLDERKKRHGVLFLAAFVLGAAFRVEALLFLFTIPLSVLFTGKDEQGDGLRLLGGFLGASFGVLILLIIALALAGLNVAQLAGSQFSAYLPFISDALAPDAARSAEMGRAIFGDFAANFTGDYLPVFMTAGFFAIMIAFLIRGIGAPFLMVLLAGTITRTWHLPRRTVTPLLVVVAVNGLIALGFLIATRFLSSRYVMLMCVVIALFIPVLLARLIQLARERGWEKLTVRVTGVLLVYCAIDAYVSFGADRSYLQEAGDWVAENSSESTSFLTNNRLAAYYSNRVEDYDRIQFVLTEELILELPSGSLVGFEEDTASVGLFDRPALQDAVEEVIRFGEEAGRQVIIYRRL